MNFCAPQGEDLFDGLSVGAGELGVPFVASVGFDFFVHLL
jgi:hypothetical protein